MDATSMANAAAPGRELLAALGADTVESLDRVLSRIRLLDGIANTEISLLLSTHKL